MASMTKGKFSRREQLIYRVHEQSSEGKELLNKDPKELAELGVNRVSPMKRETVVLRHVLSSIGR